jgi:tape measure domain-containing protein
MATESLIVELDADNSKYNKEMAKSGAVTNKTSDLTKNLTKAVVALAAAIGVREFAKYADTWKSIQNELRIVTKDTKDLANTTENLLAISQETGAAIDSTSTLYAKLARSTQDLDVSQKDLLDVTEAINKSFTLSGASANETSGAIRQLAQGLASGTLRGDEFNSVAEQAPVIMEAVAKTLGVTRGELRELAAQGKISSEVLIDSMLNYKDTVDSQFATASITLERGFQTAENATIQFVGELDSALGVTDAIAEAMFNMSKDTDANADSARALGAEIKSLAASWSTSFDQMSLTTGEFNDELDAVKFAAGEVAKFLRDAFVNLPANIKASLQIAIEELFKFFSDIVDSIDIFALEAKKGLEQILPDFAQDDEAIAGIDAQIEKINELREARASSHETKVEEIFAERDAAISAGNAVLEQEAKEQEQREERREEKNEIADEQEAIDKERDERIAERKLKLEEELKNKKSKSDKNAEKEKKKQVDLDKKLELQKLNNQSASIDAAMAINNLFFKDNKAVAAGLIVADTATGIQKSLAINPYDYGNVALIAATGAANLANALSSSKGGGSISSGVSSGGGSDNPSSPVEPAESSLEFTEQGAESNTMRIVLSGDNGEVLMDSIATSMEERTRQGR